MEPPPPQQPPPQQQQHPNRKVFLGGLSWETTGERLRAYFENWGVVRDAFVSCHRADGRPRGFGFVVFEDAGVAETVVSQRHTIDRRQVRHRPTRKLRVPLQRGWKGTGGGADARARGEGRRRRAPAGRWEGEARWGFEERPLPFPRPRTEPRSAVTTLHPWLPDPGKNGTRYCTTG
eukprot:363283-Chlamydomonas_euryale.AAC.3